MLLLRQPGEWVAKDEAVAEIIDPIADTVKVVRARAGGHNLCPPTSALCDVGRAGHEDCGEDAFCCRRGLGVVNGDKETVAVSLSHYRILTPSSGGQNLWHHGALAIVRARLPKCD